MESQRNLIAFNSMNSLNPLTKSENVIYFVSIHHYEVPEDEELSIDHAYIFTPDSEMVAFSNLTKFMNSRYANNRMFNFNPTIFEAMQWFEKVYVADIPTVIYLHNSFITNFTPDMQPLLENFWTAKFQ